MRKIDKIIETKKAKSILETISDEIKYNSLITFCELLDNRKNNGENIGRSLQIFGDILSNNNLPSILEYMNLYEVYKTSKSSKEKLNIRYGDGRGEEYANLLSEKHKGIQPNTWMKPAYWIQKGYTEEEAIKKVSETQSATLRKRHKKQKDMGYNYREINPLCVEYWEKRGKTIYDYEQYKKNICNFSDEWMIAKYGSTEATKLKIDRYSTRSELLFKKYGKYTMSSGRQSKIAESFFKKLTKDLLENFELDENKIFTFGIGRNTELARTDIVRKRTYFYDYTLLDIDLIVEFNGLYWHPRELGEWNRSLEQYNERKIYDYEKIEFIKDCGFEVIIVWEDENFDEKIEEIRKYVETRLCR
jgi:very-short-patch-repair endonuclease